MKLFQILILFFVVSFYSCSSSDTDDMAADSMEMMSPNEEEMTNQTLMGDFVNDTHPTSGVAKVNVDKTKLLFQEFKSDDGPKLLVYLSNDIKASEYVDLGDLKGLMGDFEYDVPANVDFNKYKYVLIWCVDFSVNFGYAELK